MNVAKLLPKCKINKINNTVNGIPPNISQNLSINKSIVPPKYPEIEPQIKPNVKHIANINKPTNKDVLNPEKDTFNKSLPLSSVPTKYMGIESCPKYL